MNHGKNFNSYLKQSTYADEKENSSFSNCFLISPTGTYTGLEQISCQRFYGSVGSCKSDK